MTSVRIAVRVRPLNKREKKLSSKVIIHMSENTTSIYKPSNVLNKEEGKRFSFDYSYDSSDKESLAYASQEKIFEDIGHDVLKSAFDGFNVCIFAYGQSGSGKSYTMMGQKEDQGLIPRICEGLFLETSHQSKTDAANIHTEVSYLEIYNEHVKDLLKTRAPFPVGGRLRVREHPKDGPYVENLSRIAVKNVDELKDLIVVGDNNRATASTDMNDVSSRSHAIFTIMLTQVFFDAELPREVLSKIHLVDLAGSERVDASHTTGIRLKEGANINKSLVTLGSVISALADMSVGVQSTKKKQLFIPYRNSVLTWLLKDSLGGNAMTTMIATISPADHNYMETLTTLRYASRVKNIQNTPIVNEDGSMKTNQLQAEVTRLQKRLEEATQALHEKCSPSVKAENTHQDEEKDEIVSLRKEGSGVVIDCILPHLIGLDDDPCSTSITLYLLKEGTTQIGCDEVSCDQNIVLHGPDVLSQHCVIANCAGTVTLSPQHGALCSVNESVVTDSCQLPHGFNVQNMVKEGRAPFNIKIDNFQEQSYSLEEKPYLGSTIQLKRPSKEEKTSKMNNSKAKRAELNDPGIGFTSVPTLKLTTVISGSHPVPHNTFELDGDALLHGVSTRDDQQQERDLYHQSWPGPVFEMLQTEAHSEAKIASYQGEEVWSGDTSLQQATLLSLGDGCDMEPRGNANEFQGVVTECNNGRPDSGGSSLGSRSHQQSSGQTSSVSSLPQSSAHSQVDGKNHSRNVASCPAEETTSGAQLFIGEMDNAGDLQVISRACQTGTAPALVQQSRLGSLYNRVSGLVHDASHLVWNAPSVLQQIVEVRLYPIRARWTSNLVSLVRKGNVSSVVKGCHVFLIRGSFVFSLFKDSHIVSMVKAFPLSQYILMDTTQLKTKEAAQIIQDYRNSDLIQPPLVTSPETHTKGEGMTNEETLLFDNSWSSPSKDAFDTDSKQHSKLRAELLPIKQVSETQISNKHHNKYQPSEALRTVQIIQTLIKYPDSLLKLQTLSMPDMIDALQSINSAPGLTSSKIAALYWLNVATCSHPNPQPALLILTETQLNALTNDSGELVLFHQLPLLQLKEVQVGLSGHSLRLMGSTQESILGVYTYSQAHTKEMCRALLDAICPEVSWVTRFPLLNRNLMEICLKWETCVPDLQLDSGLRVCCQFQKSLRNLVYLLHCNMNEDTIPLGTVCLLQYTSVVVNMGPSGQSEHVAQFFLTDTHFGMVQENAAFSLSQHSATVPPCHLQFHNLTFRQFSDVCCVLVHEKEASGSVRLDVIFANVRARGHPEGVMEAATPSAHALNSSPHAEVWKLTFSCSSEAACLINHLSNV